MQYAVAVSLEAQAQGIRLFRGRSVPRTSRPGRTRGKEELLGIFAGLSRHQAGAHDGARRAPMGQDDLACRCGLTRSHAPTVATKGDRNERR